MEEQLGNPAIQSGFKAELQQTTHFDSEGASKLRQKKLEWEQKALQKKQESLVNAFVHHFDSMLSQPV